MALDLRGVDVGAQVLKPKNAQAVPSRIGDALAVVTADASAFPRTYALKMFLRDKVKTGMTKEQIERSPMYKLAMRELAYKRGTANAALFRSEIIGMLDQTTAHVDKFNAVDAVTRVVRSGDKTLGDALHKAYSGASEKTPDGFKVIAQAVAKIAGDIPIKFAELPGGLFGGFYADLREIHIRPNVGSSIVWLALHEGVHAATVRAVHENPGLQKQLYTLMEHVGAQDKSLMPAYGMSNTLEFLAEGLSNDANSRPHTV